MIIQEIPFGSPFYEQMKRFRDDILRRPIGLVLSAEDLAGEDSQIHIAAVEADEVVGTVVLKPLSPQLIKLRQMAVSPQLQGKGIGRDLVRFAEDIARDRGFQTIQMTARITAIGFYQKLGYRTVGDQFIEVTLPTITMTRLIRDTA